MLDAVDEAIKSPPIHGLGKAAGKPSPVLQRSQGTVSLSFKSRGGRTVIDHVRQSGCCKVRFPRPEPGSPPDAVLLNTSGGLTDGDDIATDIAWKPGTTAVVTSQAAERIYRSRGAAARIASNLSVSDGAFGLWLPQETIQFDHGRVERKLSAEIGERGQLLACEATVFGRTAMGERVTEGLLGESWRIRQSGRLVFADGFHIDGDLDRLLSRPAIASGATAIATLIYMGTHAPLLIDPVREALWDKDGWSGCSLVDELFVARFLHTEGAGLRRNLVTAITQILKQLSANQRPGDPGIPGGLPRVWFC